VSKKGVVIVIPLSNRSNLTDSEKLSLRHLEHFLGEYDKYFLAPYHLNFSYSGIPIIRFKNKYFGSLDAHTRLSLSQEFYQKFKDYKYMLMYHLDSLVFDSNLDEWCNLGYDFIGPPWIKGPDLPWLKDDGVGNTGFSLRKVESFIKLLKSKVYWRDPAITKYDSDNSSILKNIRGKFRMIGYRIKYFNNIQRHIENHIKKGKHDDLFLFHYARKYYPEFKIAPLDTALQFGFEAHPKKCYELNGKKLPLGCHAWEKFDRKFWEPHLLVDHS
jgi:hypothetical protein